MDDILSIDFSSQVNTLTGKLSLAQNQIGGVLFVSGGGLASLEKPMMLWQEHLAQRGYSSLTFNFPGVADSTGIVPGSSLHSRLQDTKNALDYFIQHTHLKYEEIALCGRSMGAPLVLRLAIDNPFKATILLFPAAYHNDTFEIKFGDPKFRELLVSPQSWKESNDFMLAKKLRENTLVVYGDQDEVIPSDIQDRYRRAVAAKHFVMVPGMGHNTYLWDDDEQSKNNRQIVFDKTIEFINNH